MSMEDFFKNFKGVKFTYDGGYNSSGDWGTWSDDRSFNWYKAHKEFGVPPVQPKQEDLLPVAALQEAITEACTNGSAVLVAGGYFIEIRASKPLPAILPSQLRIRSGQ